MKEVMLTAREPENSPRDYRSYLVRLWREETTPRWRASVRSILTGEERHFAQLEQLFVFLYTQTVDETEFDIDVDIENRCK